MSTNSPGTGSQSNTFAHVQGKTQVKTASYTITQSEAVAIYIYEDLTLMIQQRNINLSKLLAIPSGQNRYTDTQMIEFMCDDIAHMLRDGLIQKVHFLLYDQQIDATTKAYPLFYQATYEVSLQRGLKPAGPQRHGGSLAPPQSVPRNTGFAILLDWHPNADMDRRQRVVYPAYNMNWVTPGAQYDATTLVRYREGSLTADGATIVERNELTTPNSLHTP